jgi:hypothetical protein
MMVTIGPARCPGCNAANGELHALMCVFRPAEPAPAQPQAEPDMRHPKIQALIGAKARREIELMLVEQLLDEGPDTETTSMDMEYWGPMHDRLREKLIQASSAPTAQPTTDALPNTLPLLEWATERWYDEVSNRPLVNKNRRTLDDTWRQVIRYAGGNPDELLGQSHDAEIESMRANTGAHGIGEQLPTAQPVQPAPVSAEDALPELRIESDDETTEFYFAGRHVGTATYDEHGSAGTRGMKELAQAMCAALAAKPAMSAADTLTVEALTFAREYVYNASHQLYDGTNGQGIRDEAVRRLKLIDAALAAKGAT